MGPSSDPLAVVDKDLNVYGVQVSVRLYGSFLLTLGQYLEPADCGCQYIPCYPAWQPQRAGHHGGREDCRCNTGS